MGKIKLVETECSCDKCQYMCHAPCCPTPSEVEKLIKMGFGPRLMLDDDPADINPEPIIKPALKGYEGKRAPYNVASELGCTFWKDGKCELHTKGLKPFTGRYTHHNISNEHWKAVCEKVTKSWGTKKASKLIKRFKKFMGITEK